MLVALQEKLEGMTIVLQVFVHKTKYWANLEQIMVQKAKSWAVVRNHPKGDLSVYNMVIYLKYISPQTTNVNLMLTQTLLF